MFRFTKSCAIAAALAVPAIANADVKVEQLAEDKVVITYESAEATSETGRAELERKVRKQARKVCGSQKLRISGSMAQWQKNRACYADAVASAMATIEKNNAA